MIGRAIEWAFRDRRTGRITIGQWPNLPLWLFIALTALAWATAAASSSASVWLHRAAYAALAWWAADEILRGVNPWRRALGAATLVGLAAFLALRGGG